ncbi:prepilin signal peptidase PulO-like peptidase [Actinobacteria bacterium IMCC26256]|nr:prepilin signal peptidase PulO-like peptidase [Actinobacteria bacterium IMCC26256]
MTGFVIAISALLGLLIGSFLNVVIWRVPRHESVVTPPSRCPGCEQLIRPYDNIPVLSWLILRGKCRSCKTKISARYPLVEAGTAILWGLLAWRFAGSWALPAYLVLAAGLVALSLIDLDTFLLPNRIVYPLTVAVTLLFGVAGVLDGGLGDFRRALLCGLVVFAVFLLLHLISPRGMGFGDVKFSFVLGVALGWVSPATAFLGIFMGFLLGSVVGIGLIATKVKTRKDYVPFGPFMALGTVSALLIGPPILRLLAQ